MEFSARQIADILQGNVEGDDNAVVTDLSKIEEGKTGTLTFLANPAYTEYIYKTEATIAIVSQDFKTEKPIPSTLTLVKVADARMAFGKLLEAYSGMMKPEAGIHPTAIVSADATVSKSAYIGPNVVIEAGAEIADGAEINANAFIGAFAKIGKNSVLHARTFVGHRCVVGADCMMQPGAIIGGDGFGFAPNATLGSTIIRKGVKLDNLIQVAHNVEIGENTVIAAQTGIAGSTKIGKNCMIGGQVGIVGHITIADEVKIAAQSGIGKSITEKGQIVQGSPALPIGDYKRSYVHFRKLHKMADEIDQLKKKLLKSHDNG
jgi:UDP-3-O-[3-hydroxymyristoyl] glucosamine N-acyltransferase